MDSMGEEEVETGETKKLLANMLVKELVWELERRNMPTGGVKNTLVQRLEQVNALSLFQINDVYEGIQDLKHFTPPLILPHTAMAPTP